jgi:NAD+ synthase (glutamine-hydrolysing)
VFRVVVVSFVSFVSSYSHPARISGLGCQVQELTMRIALAQLNFTIGAFEQTYRQIRAAVDRARAAGAQMAVFTELATTGYPPRDLLNHDTFIRANLELLDRIAALTDERFALIVGCVTPNTAGAGKPLFNTAALCQGGTIVGRHHKTLLPTYDVFDEDRYFEPGLTVEPFDCMGQRLGLTVCEEVWNDRDFWPKRLYARDPVCELADQGANVLINISSSPFTIGKAQVRRQMIRQEAAKNARPFVYVNQVGGNDELVFDGHSLVFDAQGRVVLRGRDFEEDFLVCDVPGPAGTNVVTETAAWVMAGTEVPAPHFPQDAPPGSSDPEPGLSHVEPGLSDVEPGLQSRRDRLSGVEPGLQSRRQDADPDDAPPEEQAFKALTMGLRDYVRKCGFSRVVLGLSGGIDSAVTACLAAAALGPEHVTGVAMPTRYSSAGSVEDAEALARNLGIGYRIIPIDTVFGSYLDALGPVFAGLAPDVTEENIQARVRGGVLMALSNKFGALLLTTGNKSEIAVGYCTLYGDMAGGLAVISDVPKTFVYRLAEYINARGPQPVIPRSTITKAPSAELRPDQTDQDSLPPYDLLDRIIEAYVERNLDIDGIAALGVNRDIAVRVVSLIDRNEYKRRQAAPGLKITSKAFGVGRRYPIAADYGEMTRARAEATSAPEVRAGTPEP